MLAKGAPAGIHARPFEFQSIKAIEARPDGNKVRPIAHYSKLVRLDGHTIRPNAKLKFLEDVKP